MDWPTWLVDSPLVCRVCAVCAACAACVCVCVCRVCVCVCVVQYAAGVISALQQSDKSTAWEELMGVEKLIIHTVKDPSEKSSLQQLVELLSVGAL